MKNSYTRGPWKVYDEGSDTIYVGTVSANEKAGWMHDSICALYFDAADNYDTNNDYRLFDNAVANSHLISAAPDMYEALKLCKELFTAKGLDNLGLVIIEAAIAKAEGKKT